MRTIAVAMTILAISGAASARDFGASPAFRYFIVCVTSPATAYRVTAVSFDIVTGGS